MSLSMRPPSIVRCEARLTIAIELLPRLFIALCVCAAILPGGGRAYQRLTRQSVGVTGELQTTVVADLGRGARCTRLAAAGDDLYVLDAAAEHVRRYTLNGLPSALQFTQVMRWREGDNGLIIGRPLDLSLVGERLFILDGLGALWSYWGPDYARAIVPLRLQSNQGSPVSAALHGTDLLLLDDKRQVWDYASSGGGYDTVPHPLLARSLAGIGAAHVGVTARALLVLRTNGAITDVPWGRTMGARLPIALSVTGLWSDAARVRFLVTSARELAIIGAVGAVQWRATVGGLNGETLRDVALSPGGKLYLLTNTRHPARHGARPRSLTAKAGIAYTRA